jgi:hypothetical protein
MLKSKFTAYSVTEIAWMLEPKEHYGKVHRQYHSAPKTTTHCPARGLKFIASSLLHTCDSLPAVQSRIAGLVVIEDAERAGKVNPGQTVRRSQLFTSSAIVPSGILMNKLLRTHQYISKLIVATDV